MSAVDVTLVDTVRALFGDLGPAAAREAAARVSDDVVMIEGGDNLRTGEHRGRPAMGALLGRVQEVCDHFRSDMVWVKPLGTDGDTVVSLAHAVGGRGDRTIDTYVLTVVSAGPDGKIAEIRDLPYDWAAWEEFFAK